MRTPLRVVPTEKPPVFMGRRMKKAEMGGGYELIAHGQCVEVWPYDDKQWRGTLTYEGPNSGRDGPTVSVFGLTALATTGKLEVAVRDFQRRLQKFLGPAGGL